METVQGRRTALLGVELPSPGYLPNLGIKPMSPSLQADSLPAEPRGKPQGKTVKNLPAMQETWVWSLGQEDSPGEGNGNPLQYSCLENSMDRGAWWATVHGVKKSRTWLSDYTFTFKEFSRPLVTPYFSVFISRQPLDPLSATIN